MSQDTSVLLCTSGYDRTIKFWDAPSGRCSASVRVSESQINTLVISPDKKKLAAGGNPMTLIYDIQSLGTGKSNTEQKLEGHSNNVVAVGYPNHQKWLYTVSEDGSLKVWDTRENKSQRSPTIHEKKKVMLTCAVLHPNQGEIVIGDQSGTISIYELRTDKIRTQWKPESKSIPIRSVSMSPFSHLLIAANNKGTCYVYEPSHQVNKSEGSNPSGGGSGSGKAGAGAGAAAAAPESESESKANGAGSNGEDNCVTIVQGNTAADKNGMYYLTHKIAAHDTYCLKCLLSPDCKYLATSSSDQTIKVFEVSKDFKLFNRLVGHRKWVWDMAFSADSAYLVSASSDTTSKLWDLKSSQAIVHYDDHTKGVTSVALNDSS